jgi:uncharacterized protein (DUF3820 family)
VDIKEEDQIHLKSNLPFGKYKGAKVTLVLEEDPEYLVHYYLNNEPYMGDDLIEEMINRRLI